MRLARVFAFPMSPHLLFGDALEAGVGLSAAHWTFLSVHLAKCAGAWKSFNLATLAWVTESFAGFAVLAALGAEPSVLCARSTIEVHGVSSEAVVARMITIFVSPA